MTTSLIFLPIFVGLLVALTVVAADLLSPKTEKSKGTANKVDGKRAAAA